MASSGQTSCDSCPVAKHLADKSTDASLHDSLDDCLSCRRGFYADSEGTAECTSCVAGKYMAEFIDGILDSEDDCTVRTGTQYGRCEKLELLSLVPADYSPSLIATNPLAPPSLTHRYAALEPIQNIRTHQHATTARPAPTSTTTPPMQLSITARLIARFVLRQRTAHRAVRRALRLVLLAVSWGLRTHCVTYPT